MRDNSRQEKVFDTKKLLSAKVAIIGSGPISNFLCAYMGALGVGEVAIVDNAMSSGTENNEFMSRLSGITGSKVNCLDKAMGCMNPDTVVHPYASVLNKAFLKDSSVVIDTTNNPESKYRCFRHSDNDGALFISCSSTQTCASVSTYVSGKKAVLSLEDLTLDEYSGFDQGSFTSGLAAALAIDEARKRICKVDGDRPLEERISFSIMSPDRFMRGRVPEKYFKTPINTSRMLESARNRKALVIGAGGIGTYALISLAMLGINITLYDGDYVEEHNLNRQILHYGGVGRNKADIAGDRLRVINPDIRVKSFPYNATKEMLKARAMGGAKYDVVFSCVDSWHARKMLSEYSRMNRTPIFNGGVTTSTGVVNHYIPGHMHCLECHNNYKKRIQETSGSVSCGNLESNVVMPNAIVGSLLVAESMPVFADMVVPARNDTKISYDSNRDSRFLQKKLQKNCHIKDYYRRTCKCHTYLDDGR